MAGPAFQESSLGRHVRDGELFSPRPAWEEPEASLAAHPSDTGCFLPKHHAVGAAFSLAPRVGCGLGRAPPAL